MMTSDVRKTILLLDSEGDRILEVTELLLPEKKQAVSQQLAAYRAARQQLRRMELSEENQAAIASERPKKSTLIGYASSSSIGKGEMVRPVMMSMDALNKVGGRPEEQQEEERSNASSDRADSSRERRLEEAEVRLVREASALAELLHTVPGMDEYLEGSGVRIRQNKYDEAVELTTERRVGEEDFFRGMEYFARLGAYLDAPKRFAACNNALFAAHSKMMLILPPVAAAITILVYYFAHIHVSISPKSEVMGGSVLLASLPWALFFAVIAYGVGECILMVMMMLRKWRMQKRHVYSGSEEEWELAE